MKILVNILNHDGQLCKMMHIDWPLSDERLVLLNAPIISAPLQQHYYIWNSLDKPYQIRCWAKNGPPNFRGHFLLDGFSKIIFKKLPYPQKTSNKSSLLHTKPKINCFSQRKISKCQEKYRTKVRGSRRVYLGPPCTSILKYQTTSCIYHCKNI
jgi:hypothetical protein